MKKVGRCIECSRQVYINEDRFCKRCYRDAMLSGRIKSETPAQNTIIEEDTEE